ncbi:stage 0 sporulation family protein [bacterium]|nr:stage 0 sporulation family protein [bacterium]
MAKVLEIEFKGGRKEFFSNPQEFPFITGDLVIVDVDKGEDLGSVVNMGSLVDKRVGDIELRPVNRKPGPKDVVQFEENLDLEEEAFVDCRKRIEEHGLSMKLVDVEYQFDRKKITFYFTADNRVDFRELVRDLAGRYRTRIELRQIGVRDEAKRIGGIGVCGKPLCCSMFLRSFEPVITQCAKDQNLALNPTKLSGACGRLMCCLRYERDFYLEVLQRYPEIGSKIKTPKGTGVLEKIDVINENAVIRYESGEESILCFDDFNEMLEKNKKETIGKKIWNKKKKNKDRINDNVQD